MSDQLAYDTVWMERAAQLGLEVDRLRNDNADLLAGADADAMLLGIEHARAAQAQLEAETARGLLARVVKV